MGLFERLFGLKSKQLEAYAGRGSLFETLTAYRPAFTSWGGRMYESELIRAVVDAKARHFAKMRVDFVGSAKPSLKAAVKAAPNEWQTWPQMLYRLSTILDICNNVCIVPVLDDYGQLTGYYPVLPTMCELVSVDGKPYLRYTFRDGQKAAIEYERCAILTRFQFQDDIFGENNNALDSTLALLDMEKQGIEEGIKNSATFRFIAKLTYFAKPEDLAKEQKRFNSEHLRGEGNGMLLFPSTYTDIKQVDSKPYAIDAEQTKLIQTNVFNYFGGNEKILQNTALGDDLDAFYEGMIEPQAIQLADGLTRMTYSAREIGTGNRVNVSANRLQYMSTGNKIALAQQMGDRGVLTIDEIRELFNYPELPDGLGKHAPIRGEYWFTDQGKVNNDEQAE